MQKSIKKNYIYNLLYQIFLLIAPLITTPYISRTLLSSGVGEYSFSLSIANYFVIFATFGFTYYAQKKIANYVDDKKKQSLTFWEVFVLKIIFSMIAVIAFEILILSNIFEKYNRILTILIINIVSVAFDVSYMLQGNEDFKKIVLVNFFVKVLGIASVFIFVKGPDDVWIYALINSLISLISNLFLFIFVPSYLTKIKIKELNVRQHVMSSFKLFIPTIAISVYCLLDKTLIGIITKSDSQVGYYEQADKICKICLTIVTSLSAVMIPNNAKHFARHDYEKVNDNVRNALRFSTLIGIPVFLGIIIISENIIPWFLGDAFEESIPLTRVLCLIVMAIGLNNVFGIQYLIPINKEKIFTISVTLGAFINFVLNIILISYYDALGAAIATVIAETSILVFQWIYLRKTFSFKSYLKSTYKYLISGILMFAIAFPISTQLSSSILNTILIIGISAAIYFLSLLILKDEMVTDIIGKVIKKLRREANEKN